MRPTAPRRFASRPRTSRSYGTTASATRSKSPSNLRARINSASRCSTRRRSRFRDDGRPAYEGKVAPFDTAQQEDLKRLVAGGSIKLNRNAAPGRYVLQVVVTDLLAGEKRHVATQWIDFELTR
jgi:hypothetical protein